MVLAVSMLLLGAVSSCAEARSRGLPGSSIKAVNCRSSESLELPGEGCHTCNRLGPGGVEWQQVEAAGLGGVVDGLRNSRRLLTAQKRPVEDGLLQPRCRQRGDSGAGGLGQRGVLRVRWASAMAALPVGGPGVALLGHSCEAGGWPAASAVLAACGLTGGGGARAQQSKNDKQRLRRIAEHCEPNLWAWPTDLRNSATMGRTCNMVFMRAAICLVACALVGKALALSQARPPHGKQVQN